MQGKIYFTDKNYRVDIRDRTCFLSQLITTLFQINVLLKLAKLYAHRPHSSRPIPLNFVEKNTLTFKRNSDHKKLLAYKICIGHIFLINALLKCAYKSKDNNLYLNICFDETTPQN